MFGRTTSDNVPFRMNTSGSCELPLRGLIFRVLRLGNYAALQNIPKLLDQYSSCKADHDNNGLTMPDEKAVEQPELTNENSSSASKSIPLTSLLGLFSLSYHMCPRSLVRTRQDGPAVSICRLAACRSMQVCSSIRRLVNQSSDFCGREDSEQGTDSSAAHRRMEIINHITNEAWMQLQPAAPTPAAVQRRNTGGRSGCGMALGFWSFGRVC